MKAATRAGASRSPSACPSALFTKPPGEGAVSEQRRNLALDARVPFAGHHRGRCADARAGQIQDRGRDYLGLRSIFWSLVRAKSDDDLREAAARLWSMAVGLEDGEVSEAQAALRAAQEALRNAPLDRGAGDQELKQLMDQLRAAMDRFMQAMQEQLKNNQLSRPLDRQFAHAAPAGPQEHARPPGEHGGAAAPRTPRELLQQLEQILKPD